MTSSSDSCCSRFDALPLAVLAANMIGFSYMIHDSAKKGDEFFDIMCRLWYWCARIFVN